MKILAGVLALVVVALVWSVFTLQSARREMVALQQSNQVVIHDFSNRWNAARRSLDEQKQVNDSLQTSLTDRAQMIETLRVEMANLKTDLARSQAETKNAQGEIAKRDSHISGLEGRNVDLTRQMGDLQNAIAGLEQQIEDAERRIAASEGNRQHLLEDLQRLQDEKLALEKQLNDLAYLRDQVRKLKDELSIARRLDWIRRGLYSPTPRKGAEALADLKFNPEPEPEPASTLDVEIFRSGEIRIQESTNTAPTPP